MGIMQLELLIPQGRSHNGQSRLKSRLDQGSPRHGGASFPIPREKVLPATGLQFSSECHDGQVHPKPTAAPDEGSRAQISL
ncbi:hypothetical protein DHEL01_v202634 [Diaporthe helianthi]|uniref:Uncharacterized protein n=1 Tax=Diaporthe helianthi TaxID=158607 RepID=A0A2P5I903_DIAHE|nr:hypothetical protein DHEL01_v202634 [Diaporthe helianthi]